MNKLIITFLFVTSLLSTDCYSLELTPLMGYRGGGEFIDDVTDKKHTIASSSTYGFIIADENYGNGKSLELYYSHQSSDLNSININLPSPTSNNNIPLTIDYLHLGGTTPIPNKSNIDTFVSGGLGFTYLSPDFTGLQSDLRASLSIGIGLKWPITNTIALRFETRGLATFFNNNSSIFCSGGCTIKVSGNFFMQAEAFAGLIFKF